MKAKLFINVFVLIFMVGCTAMNDGLTPDPKIVKNDFDGSIEIHQPTVSSARGISEDWTTLGFVWTQKNPNFVIVEAGISGISGISHIAFNVDGEIIEVRQQSHSFTQFDLSKYADWSRKSFVMGFDDFYKVANGETVKFKVSLINNTYGVSTFGKAHPTATISQKIPKFLALLTAHRN